MTGAEKIVPVVVSIVIIVLVAPLAQERSREMAAIVAVTPLPVPLAARIVRSSSGGDHQQQTARFVGSIFAAYLPTVVFVTALWVLLRHAWSFPLTLIGAFAVWAALPHVVRRLP